MYFCNIIYTFSQDANNIGEDRRMMSIPYYVKGM